MTEIRQALETDFDGIWEIIKVVLRQGDTYPHSPTTNREEAFEYWMTTSTAAFIALDKGEILGTYYLRPNQPDLGSHVCNGGYMVKPGARNRGIGTAMGRHSIAEAKRLGFKAMQFNLVVATNESSIRLWNKLGFDLVGTLPKAFNHKDFGFVDAFVMYKLL